VTENLSFFDLTPPTHRGGEPVEKPPYTRHRKTDPDTSREAAYKVAPNLRASQLEVLALFRKYGEMTDYQLVVWAGVAGCRQSTSGLRTRRSELVESGHLERKGKAKVQGSNRIVWGQV